LNEHRRLPNAAAISRQSLIASLFSSSALAFHRENVATARSP
jgi:hypothetical protein